MFYCIKVFSYCSSGHEEGKFYNAAKKFASSPETFCSKSENIDEAIFVPKKSFKNSSRHSNCILYSPAETRFPIDWKIIYRFPKNLYT